MDNLHLLSSLLNMLIWLIMGFVFGFIPINFNSKAFMHNFIRIISYSFISLFSGLLLSLNFGFPEKGIDMGTLTVISAILCILMFHEASPNRKRSTTSSRILQIK